MLCSTDEYDQNHHMVRKLASDLDKLHREVLQTVTFLSMNTDSETRPANQQVPMSKVTPSKEITITTWLVNTP